MSEKKTNKKKVLFVYPEVPISFWSFKYVLSFVGKKAAFPPLGLLTIAGLMPEDYDITLVDMNVEKLTEDAILESDLIFISAMIIQKKSFAEVVELCNRLRKPVVAGGPYPTVNYKSINGVDHFVLNEAEITLPQFLEDYNKGEAKPVYLTDIKPDINTAPIPQFDLCDIDKYSTMMLQFSRGCPYNCEFCDIIELFGHTPRTKTPEKFVAEMDSLYNTGYRGVLFIVDDNFIGNKRKVKELLKEIIRFQEKRGYPFKLDTEASVDLAADEELLDLMRRARFNMVFLGIETPDEESLLAINKKQNVKINLMDSIRKIQHYGLEVSAGFIVGFDTDPEDIFDRQINFIDQSAIPMAMVGLLTTLPNTQLYRRLKSENRIIGESSGNNTHDLELDYIPVMDPEILIEGYKNVIRTIYTPKNYFKRCSEMVVHMNKGIKGPKPKYTFKSMAVDVKAFFRSFNRQFFSSYSWDYFKFFVRSLFNKPSMFVKTISKGALGHHFITISNEIVEMDNFRQYVAQSFEELKSYLDNMDKGKNLIMMIKMLSVHKQIVKRTAKKMREAEKSPFYHIENKKTDIVNIFQNYLNLLNDTVGDKINNIQHALVDLLNPRFKAKDLLKIIKIGKQNRKLVGNFAVNVREVYEKAEFQIRNLLFILITPAAIPVKAQ